MPFGRFVISQVVIRADVQAMAVPPQARGSDAPVALLPLAAASTPGTWLARLSNPSERTVAQRVTRRHGLTDHDPTGHNISDCWYPERDANLRKCDSPANLAGRLRPSGQARDGLEADPTERGNFVVAFTEMNVDGDVIHLARL